MWPFCVWLKQRAERKSLYHGVGATDNPWSGNVNWLAHTTLLRPRSAAPGDTWWFFPVAEAGAESWRSYPPPPPPPPRPLLIYPFFVSHHPWCSESFCKKYCGRTFQLSASSFRPQSAKRSTPSFFFLRGMDTGVTICSSFIFFGFLCNNNLYDSNSQQ